mgnify:CR=1 FL=1
MIQIDSISAGLTMIAIMFSLFLFTFEQQVTIIFPLILLVTGITLTLLFGRKVDYDESLEYSEMRKITITTALCLATFALATLVSSDIFFPFIKREMSIGDLRNLSVVSLRLYTFLMAIAEEWFFRGGILSFTARINRFIAPIINGLVFTLYHFSIYGTQYNHLFYVLLAGSILAYATLKTERLSPAMIAHAVNNLMASLYFGGK